MGSCATRSKPASSPRPGGSWERAFTVSSAKAFGTTSVSPRISTRASSTIRPRGSAAPTPALQGVAARFTMWDVHAQYRIAGLDLQALYAAGTLGDADKITAATVAAKLADPSVTAFAAPKSMKGAYA